LQSANSKWALNTSTRKNGNYDALQLEGC